MRRIAKAMLADLVTSLRTAQGVFLRFEPEAEAFVARAGFDPARGARELRRAVERLVEMPLANLALSGDLAKHPAWKAVHDDGGLYFLDANEDALTIAQNTGSAKATQVIETFRAEQVRQSLAAIAVTSRPGSAPASIQSGAECRRF